MTTTHHTNPTKGTTMRKLLLAAVVVFSLTGCNYRDIVLSHVAPVDNSTAYTTPAPCENAPYHTTFERLGIDRPC